MVGELQKKILDITVDPHWHAWCNAKQVLEIVEKMRLELPDPNDYVVTKDATKFVVKDLDFFTDFIIWKNKWLAPEPADETGQK